ncbi:MAG: glycosyltransferase family 2 protein [Candidatus Parcubacteria bacterium]|nr:glycosyltransferase family 2 protein [Candidatus Parcubacteria bacterium]
MAIILVNYNGKKYLPDCLASLCNLDYPQDDYKIIFVDNASTDDSLAYAQNSFPSLEFIKNNENLGFAAGNNVGMARALAENFDYLFLINQDTISEKDILTKLIQLAETDPQIAAVQPRLMLHPDQDKINSLGNSIHYLGFGFSGGGYQEFDGNLEPKEIAYASGAAVLIKKEVLEKIGLFAADFFMYHEDLDLGWRMRMAGYKIMLAPGAVVYHKYEFSKSIKKYYFMERNRFICLLENYKLGTLILVLPALLAMESGLFIFSIKSGFWREKLKVYGYFLSLNNWHKILGERREKTAKRVIGDAEIANLFTGKIEFQEIDNWVLKYIANPVFNAYWQIIRHLIIW